MALSFYKKKGAMVISYGTKTRKSQQGEYTQVVINMQFAPVLKENPNGMGYLYDWKDKKVVFQFNLHEALKLAENIEIAVKTNNWDKCKVYHKYGTSSKAMNIQNYKDAYMVNIIYNDIKLSIGMYLDEFKMFKDYLKHAALMELIKDGEYYFQNIDKIQKEDEQDISTGTTDVDSPEEEVNEDDIFGDDF